MSTSGWSPDLEDVEASKDAQRRASSVEDDSLGRLYSAADTDGADEEAARELRASRPDLRLDTTDVEQAHANQLTDTISWVIVGVGALIVLGSVVVTLAFGIL